MIHARARNRRQGLPATTQTVHVPAPMGGINAIQAAGMMGPGDCIHAYNVIASEYGLRTRLGSREWLTGLTGASDNLIRSVLSFKGSAKSGASDRIFVTTSRGIYNASTSYKKWVASTAYVIGDIVINDDGKVYTCDTDGVSASSGGPTGTSTNIADGTTQWDYTTTIKVLAFSTTTGNAGYGVAHAVVTSAGHFLMYADEVNGLHVYTESTTTWAAVAMGGGGTEISGVDPADLVFVTVFKGRVWAIKDDTGDLYYSAAGSIYGAYTRFSLGQKLRSGGHLVGAWSWTYDGGAGMDDSLVVVSSGGSVLIYQGTDPASSTSFSLRGVWDAGGLPTGRKIATTFGGDLLLLTRMGILPLSKLVLGGNAGEGTQYSTFKIGPLFNQLMLSRTALQGWSMVLHPEDNALVVTVPEATATATTQLAMSLANKSWSRFRDLPIYSAETHNGKFYFGTTDGRVLINDGYVDGVLLSNPNTWTAIQYAVLGAFQNLGNGNQKQVMTIRANILSESGTPSFEVAAKYNYDFTELDPVTTQASTGGPVWDSAVWDTSVWGGDYSATQALRGTAGMGQAVAIAIRGAATSRTVVVGCDVSFRQGGPLG